METIYHSEVSSLNSRLQALKLQIEAVCLAAGRNPAEITLIGVSKTHPVDLVREAISVGLSVFGENKAQEIREKATAIPGKTNGGNIEWHFIGSLQRNKAKEVVRYADFFHALDDLRLAETLNRLCSAQNRTLPCLVQVNISQEDSKSGLSPKALPEFLSHCAAFDHLQIVGLMGIAHPTEDPESVRPEFRLLRTLRDEAIAQKVLPTNAKLSMGMSDDFAVAIQEGATHIRVGSALFGTRNYSP
ncbi:MAG: YggS family pyridoxal phosphate-dependent enzyme [Bacteroidetes Order II. Incertae sedis bacterium]|nr:YggS family pyridoxal phosphate-dependent enzyme [Bacteroidetes Order II. bacterium]